MDITKINLEADKTDEFSNIVSIIQQSEATNSVLFGHFTIEHLLYWKYFRYIVEYNIYHTYMDNGIILYIKHPNQSNLKNLYINILNSLFVNRFGVFGPFNNDYYKLHVNGKAIAIAYHDPETKIDGSLIFIPKTELLEGYTPKYQTEDDVVEILSNLPI